MHSGKGLIAVDWGTTNRRIFAIGPDGTLRERLADGLGILSVPAGGFGGAIADLRARFGESPMLLAGMIGSNRGWVEAPYVRCPADLAALAAGGVGLEDGAVTIVPGVSHLADGRADVMRGEEVQILGAVAAGLVPADGIVCHPGTHAKWIIVRSGRIEAFRTVMTGEMFGLLGKHSILADLLRAEVRAGPAFTAGVRHALGQDDLLAELFSIRARTLLGVARAEDAASYASGLLIGSDIRIGLAFAGGGGDIGLIGDADLTALYAAALGQAGRRCSQIDGEEAFLAGARMLAEEMP